MPKCQNSYSNIRIGGDSQILRWIHSISHIITVTPAVGSNYRIVQQLEFQLKTKYPFHNPAPTHQSVISNYTPCHESGKASMLTANNGKHFRLFIYLIDTVTLNENPTIPLRNCRIPPGKLYQSVFLSDSTKAELCLLQADVSKTDIKICMISFVVPDTQKVWNNFCWPLRQRTLLYAEQFLQIEYKSKYSCK